MLEPVEQKMLYELSRVNKMHDNEVIHELLVEVHILWLKDWQKTQQGMICFNVQWIVSLHHTFIDMLKQLQSLI